MPRPSKYALPLARSERLLKRHGAQRVSADAAAALSEAVELYAATLIPEAVAYARHAGRVTVQRADVELAARVRPRDNGGDRS